MKRKHRVLVCFGTRPEAIKLAPLVLELRRSRSFEPFVCTTSQHREMLDQVMQFFEITSDYDLGLMRPDQDLYHITCGALEGMKPILRELRPDAVVVQGDTTSAFAVALAGFYEKIPVAHVEAGLRTWDKYGPFPEEVNRTLITPLAEWNLAPTERSRRNLRKEGVPGDKIHVTGNTGIDALFLAIRKLRKRPPALLDELGLGGTNGNLILITGHRRESFGEPFEQMCLAMADIAEAHPGHTLVYPVHRNPNVRKPVFELLGGIDNVRLIDPLAYPDFVWLVHRSRIILTDSGGIQEEAPSLGKPVLVMRDVTERPEGVRSGVVKLVGTDRERITTTAARLLRDERLYQKMARPSDIYGDGKACPRIRRILAQDLR